MIFICSLLQFIVLFLRHLNLVGSLYLHWCVLLRRRLVTIGNKNLIVKIWDTFVICLKRSRIDWCVVLMFACYNCKALPRIALPRWCRMSVLIKINSYRPGLFVLHSMKKMIFLSSWVPGKMIDMEYKNPTFTLTSLLFRSISPW